MSNIGGEQFDYNSFKLAYDSDPLVQGLTKRFDQNGIELATRAGSDADAAVTTNKKQTSDIHKSAMRAVRKRQG